MSKGKVLIVEDEEDIAQLIAHLLQKEWFETEVVFDGKEALKKLEKNIYDLILLDLMLPKIDGFELCKYIRSHPNHKETPVIMVTVKGEEIDKVLGFELGADDYITKPFSPRELIARVKAVLRRTKKLEDSKKNVIKLGDLILDKNKFKAYLKNKTLLLTPIELKILFFLAENPKRVFSREEILKAVWEEHGYISPRTVDVHIRRLRQKIEKNPEDPQLIKTLRGRGYYLDKTPDEN